MANQRGERLRDKAAAANGDPAQQQVERRDPTGEPTTRLLGRMEEQFARAMPSHDGRQIVRDAMTCLQTIRHLDVAEPRSVLGAVMNAAQLGLRPALLGHCWPLPFWDKELVWPNGRKGGYRAQLIIGYQGYIHLGYQSEQIQSLMARAVYPGDDFDYEFGSNEFLRHRPRLLEPGETRPAPIAYYAICKTTTGGFLPYVMSAEEMRQHRDRHARRNQSGGIVGPWGAAEESDDYQGMARKTVLLRLARYIPKSAQFARAMAVDEGVRTDVRPDAEPAAANVTVRVEDAPGPDGAEPQEPIRGETVPEPDPPDNGPTPPVDQTDPEEQRRTRTKRESHRERAPEEPPPWEQDRRE